MSPTARSLKHLRDLGHVAQVVEKWLPQARRRVDLFGIGDILSLAPDGAVVITQTTSGSNVAARIRKIAESEHIGRIRDCGIQVWVHGWIKQKNGRYRLREENLS